MANLEDDVLAMFIVVREDLDMSKGKACSQVGHALQNFMLKYFKMQVLAVKKDLNLFSEQDIAKLKLTTEWLEKGSRKVLLQGNEKEFLKLKTLYPDAIIIKDNGLTEVAPGSETVIALFPILKKEAPKEIRRLSVYK